MNSSKKGETEIISDILRLAKEANSNRKPVVVFDIDGTLVNTDSIKYLVSDGLREFDTFHRESINCPPHKNVLAVAKGIMDAEIGVIGLSGRQEKYRNLTNYWLAMNSLPLHELILRPENYLGNKIQFKAEAIKSLKSRFELIAIFDDDSKLLQAWKAFDIPLIIESPELVKVT
jgi:hypothetical protein